MALVFGCIVPHGDIIIPELAGNLASRVQPLTQAMEQTGRRMEAARPDTVVVLTPHGIRVQGAICVMTTEWAAGTLEDEQGNSPIKMKMACDVALGSRIAQHASQKYNVPVVTAVYGSAAGESSITPLDWGATVPLWFLGARWMPQPRIVPITTTRDLTLQQLYNLGRAIAEVAEEEGKRVALIASADWGHAHQESGPYGFHPASAQFDDQMVELIRADALDRFLDVDVSFAIEAKVDGLWQAIVLAGASQRTPISRLPSAHLFRYDCRHLHPIYNVDREEFQRGVNLECQI